ncbi:hypothetical protein M1403_03960 [Patescibacteria group bacterium]|nr:hypothetical protein [Patescibacteria group bacterium]
MDNPLRQVTDEMGELGKDTAKTFVRDVVKGVPKSIKTQVVGQTIDNGSGTADKKQDTRNKKMDPVTGKPIPTKKALTQLTQATAQYQKTKLQKLREEFDKMKLPSATPEKKQEELIAKKKSFDVVAQTLKSAESTGEFGRQVGG